MKLITKMEPVNYLVLNHNEYLLSDVVELMDTLADCDGVFNTTLVEGTLKDYLEMRGVINTNARGGSYRGSGYDQFLRELSAIIGYERW